MNFQILKQSTPQIQAGTLIDYKLRLGGIPVKWQTRIELWEPGVRFVDSQLKGPYRKWHHTHTFQSVAGGTLMTDTILYQLPLGRLGDLLAGWKVHRQIAEIFAFRKTAIEEIFR